MQGGAPLYVSGAAKLTGTSRLTREANRSGEVADRADNDRFGLGFLFASLASLGSLAGLGLAGAALAACSGSPKPPDAPRTATGSAADDTTGAPAPEDTRPPDAQGPDDAPDDALARTPAPAAEPGPAEPRGGPSDDELTESTGPRDPAAEVPAEVRAALSAFILKPAENALKSNNWQKALALYQGLVAARGPASAEARALASAWAAAGQPGEAAALLDRFARTTDDPDARREALAERDRLRSAHTARRIGPARATAEARAALRKARTATGQGRHTRALVALQIAHALDPELPEVIRALAATYRALDRPDLVKTIYYKYLRGHPTGRTADVMRRELTREPGALATLSVTSSLPCDEVWLNRQRLTRRLPIRRLAVAPGAYRALCVSYKYEIAYFEYATAVAGETVTIAFRWAVVVNALSDPPGRIAIENARNPGVLMDLGISSPEVGVIVPADGRPLVMVLRDDAGTRREQRSITLQPGQRAVIKW